MTSTTPTPSPRPRRFSAGRFARGRANGGGGGRATDADRALVRAASRRIGAQIALACALLTTGAAVLVFGYLWYRAAHPHSGDAEHRTLIVSLDPFDLVQAAILGVLFAVACAWAAAVFFSRRAVAPLADALRRQREFVANASHELRTPIAVVDARAQQIRAMAGRDPSLRPVLDELRTDVAELSRIVDEMLDLASASEPVRGSCIAVEEALAVVESARAVAGPVALEVEGGEGLSVAVPAEALRRTLRALMTNALGFAPAGSRVRILIDEGGAGVRLRVIDEGPGIEGIDPDRVFERFARGAAPDGASGAPARSSHGIGLALVREIARRYGGDARVESSGPEGTTMLLELPKEGE